MSATIERKMRADCERRVAELFRQGERVYLETAERCRGVGYDSCSGCADCDGHAPTFDDIDKQESET